MSGSTRRSVVRLSAAVVLVLIPACDVTEPPSAGETARAITLSSPSRVLVSVDDTVRLTAVVRDGTGRVLSSLVTWAVLDGAVAEVDGEGVVTAVSNGTARVTARAGSIADTVAVEVEQRPAQAEVTPSSVQLSSAGARTVLTASFYDANGHAVAGVQPTWSSTDTGVAVVDNAGNVEAIAPGTARVVASAASASDTAEAVVSGVPDPTDRVERIEIQPDSAQMYALNDTIQLNAVALDSTGAPVPGIEFQWTSLNPGIVMVDSVGRAVSKAVGTALITAYAIGCGSDTTGVTVTQGVDSVAVSPASQTLSVGESVQLAATAYDANGLVIQNASFGWTTSNSSVASVTSAGRVSAVSAGTATIRASAGGESATASIVSEQGSSTGGSLQFSSYVGGSDFEHVRDVAVDAAGNTYVVGGTKSSNFPVTSGAFQTSDNPGSPESSSVDQFDAFVMKLSPSGDIIWSSYLGGPNYDRAYGVEVDAQGFVYVAGRAGAGFPVTTGAFQTSFQGGEQTSFYGNQDGFVCKIRPDGSAVVFCSYFGTSDPHPVRDVEVDASGNIYLASGRSGGNYPGSVANQFVNSPLGGEDAVIAKIRGDGAAVLWARYMGGGGFDSHQNSVRVDGSGNPYLLFTTESVGIATGGVFQTAYAGGQDVFIAKLNSASGSIVWGSYLGGSGNESTETHELAVHTDGTVYVAASSRSTDFPTTPGAHSRTPDAAANEVFVSKISADGASLVASTFLGGSGFDRAEGVDVDALGRVYVTGTTTSTNFPLSSDAHQTSLQGGRDAFATVLSSDLSTLIYSTYLGGGASEYGRGAAVTSTGGIFVLGGETTGSGWPTLNAFQGSFRGGGADGFVTKIGQ